MEGKAQEVIKIGPDLIKKILPEEVTFEMRSKVSRKYSLLTGMAYKAVSRCQKPGAGERLVSSGLKESHCEWSREDKGESVQHEPWRGRQAQTLQDIFGQANYCSTYPKSTGKSLDGSNLGRD